MLFLLCIISVFVGLSYVLFTREAVPPSGSLALRRLERSDFLNDGEGLMKKDQVNMFIRVINVDLSVPAIRFGVRFEPRGIYARGDQLVLPVNGSELSITFGEAGSRSFPSGVMA